MAESAGFNPGQKPIVLITGAAGDIGSTLAEALARDYQVVGLDLPGKQAPFPLFGIDLGSDDSIRGALAQFRSRCGDRIASVVHLAAYFDFSGEDNPLYDEINVEGTRRLLRALRSFEVGQVVYSGTMLVHAPGKPGQRIDETAALAPKWPYPRSKAAAEEVIRQERGAIPCVLLHLAGVYDERTCVPTLAQQIARIYERDLQGHLYAGDPRAGQAMLHKRDMADAFVRAIALRRELPGETTFLVGEPETPGYEELQDEIGRLIHGEREWTTLQIPKPVAIAGTVLQHKLEPVVPDAIDRGEKPFIRPFMIRMADDHYELDVSRARRLLGWQPRHRIRSGLRPLVEALREDPPAWYAANHVTPPAWLETAKKERLDADEIRSRHEAGFRKQHGLYRWAHFANIAFGTWLLTSPALLPLGSKALAASDLVSGGLLIVFATLALSWRLSWARWACAAIGTWVMSAPIFFWAPTAAGYLNDTIVGALIVAFAVAFPPEPGVSPVAATTGPVTPPGWSYNPSAWTQRLAIIALAFVGLYVSRYLAAYQLGHIGSLWDPFFAGGPDPKNGTEEIVTSSVSQAWPVSDAAVGALTYLLEILTGAIGSTRRWRTMPWLVLLFGLMIAPLGVVSIFFIVIQPIWIGTWCTLCLVAALAMLVQIPYSLDELLATGQFLVRRRRAGESVLRVFFTGDTDTGDTGEGTAAPGADEFDRPPRAILRDIVSGGVNLPWNIAACALVGAWLMFTRLAFGSEGGMANAEHLIGAVVITVCAIACAEVTRPLRYLNVALGAALLLMPFVYETTGPLHALNAVLCAAALVLLSLRRGPVRGSYADWNRRIF